MFNLGPSLDLTFRSTLCALPSEFYSKSDVITLARLKRDLFSTQRYFGHLYKFCTTNFNNHYRVLKWKSKVLPSVIIILGNFDVTFVHTFITAVILASIIISVKRKGSIIQPMSLSVGTLLILAYWRIVKFVSILKTRFLSRNILLLLLLTKLMADYQKIIQSE